MSDFRNWLENLGVQVSADLDSLTTLNLPYKGLTALPPEIGQLGNLQSLVLLGNRLTSLPPEIVRLVNLQSLYLGDNQLTALPPEIVRLVNLQSVYLARNGLTSLPPEIVRLVNLQSLDLTTNRLTSLPPEIGQLVNLQSLYLSANQLTALPPEIGQLVNLQSLYLGVNQLTALPPEIVRLVNLQSLGLPVNQLTALPPEIGRFVNLQSLDLAGNELTALPPVIGQLVNLRSLDLAGNQLTALPPEIGQLVNLRTLYLGNNQLTALPPEIGELANLQLLRLVGNHLTSLPSEIGRLVNLQSLALRSNQLTALPPEIGQLVDLQSLDLRGNRLTALPIDIGRLVNLRELDLSDNRLSDVPASIENLVKLRRLSVQQNLISEMPTNLQRLENLEELDISHNPIARLARETLLLPRLRSLDVAGCPLARPPFDIASQGLSAMIEYFEAPDIRPLRTAKLVVVGQGAVGKTSLLRRLCDESFDPGENSTHGLRVGTATFKPPRLCGESIQINYWDFGGQDIYHATHQFFLSNNSLFVLVWSARNGFDDGKLFYWLDMIQARAPQSPILIVATNTKERSGELPFADIQAQYKGKQIRQVSIDSAFDLGIDEMKQAICEMAGDLPSIDEEWPAPWRHAIEAVSEDPRRMMSRSEFEQFLERCGVATSAVSVVTRTLHELGNILSFPDSPALKNTVVINPQWVSEHISKVLDDKSIAAHKGVVTESDLDTIWQKPDDWHRLFFLELMQQFDLSYRVEHEQDRSIVVELLSLDEDPGYAKPWDDVLSRPLCRELKMDYSLGSVPAGVPTWFIARSHRYSMGIHWRFGGLFDKDGTRGTLALLKCSQHAKTISLQVRGKMPFDFFSALRMELDYTLARFPGLSIKRSIPCPGHDGAPCSYSFEFESVLKAADEKAPEIQCHQAFKMVSVAVLLFGIDLRSQEEVLKKLEKLDSKLDEARDLSAVSLRQHLNSLQATMEPQCPSLFVLKSPQRHTAGMNKITGEKLDLQLLCEAPGELHFPADAKPYSFTPTPEWLEQTAPYIWKLARFLSIVGPAATLALPLAGVMAAGLAIDYKANLDLANELFKDLGIVAPQSDRDEHSLYRQSPSENIKLTGAERRQFHAFLKSLDPTKHWAGLEPVLQGGQVLWLCKEHAKAFPAWTRVGSEVNLPIRNPVSGEFDIPLPIKMTRQRRGCGDPTDAWDVRALSETAFRI